MSEARICFELVVFVEAGDGSGGATAEVGPDERVRLAVALQHGRRLVSLQRLASTCHKNNTL